MSLDAHIAAPRAPEGDGRRAPAPMSASARLWGMDWSKVVPREVDEEVSLELGTTEEALAFIEAHYPEIFEGAYANFHVEKMTPAKRRFFEEMDAFLFRLGERAVGLVLAHPTDWSTYYIRTFTVLPEARHRGFTAAFGEAVYGPLVAAGVERMESDTSPANVASIRVFLGEGFVVTSTLSSERWGMMLRFTKFLSREAGAVFRRQFITAPESGRNPKPERGGQR